MLNRVSFTVINGKSGLVEVTRELDLLNTPRKRGAGYLEGAPCPWPLLGGVLDLLR